MSTLDALNLQAGDVVGGYTLIAPLGGGAMGSVWRARDDGGQDYAMKILRDSLADDGLQGPGSERAQAERTSARERLRREAMALRKIDHPGVCQIVDMELDDSLAFIVTELIEGLNLRDDVAANGAYQGDDLERLARKLMTAVQAVHEAGIVHRDIKPTNVMISATGPVLVDFGIAMGAGESHVTRTGLVMGTPGFIAPEIIDGAESDEGSDWWSTAAVLAYAACGRPVFGSKPMMTVLERAASGSADLHGLPARTLAAFRAALSPKREDRPQPQELLEAISTDALQPQLWEQADLLGTDSDEGSNDGREGAAAGSFAQEGNMPGGTSGQPQTAQTSRATDNADGRDGAQTADGRDGAQTADGSDENGTEVVRPFGTNSSDRLTEPLSQEFRENPRLAWRQSQTQLLPTDSEESQTTAMTSPATQPLAETSPLRTRPLPAAPAARIPLVGSEPATAALASTPPAFAAEEATETYPAAAYPAQYEALAPAAPPEAAYQPASTSAGFIRRQAYWQHGKWALMFLGVPLAALAAILPVIALFASGTLWWALCTAGLSLGSQSAREIRRGGERKATDTALCLGALPWQVLKALLMTMPRFLALALVCAAGWALGSWALDLPQTKGCLPISRPNVCMPLVAGSTLSASALALAALLLVGWCLLSFVGGRASRTNPAQAPGLADWLLAIRLGAGALAGKPRQAILSVGQAQMGPAGQPELMSQQALPLQPALNQPPVQAPRIGPGRRKKLVLAVWDLLVLLLLAYICSGRPIEWVPLSLLRSVI
ncbi:protein kinase [Bombiscardovia nodaiensis]|uniref:non-specific serine/threonine protein kinase n=1 Tax=Bombiscardovia nodaiensis TaxID=2932181 RepID=A0ABM8BAF5_9BIFI|nr:protein kinase [Bombiscardovia nodaiensis]